MIRSAAEVWESQKNHAEFYQACEGVMNAIKRASNEGSRDTYFTPSPYKLYDSVKAEFQKYGYTFKPVGFEGGVWQDCEKICW